MQGWALLTLAAAAVVVGSIFMEWGTETLFGDARSARAVPVQLLWDTVPASLDDFPLMWPLLLGAVLMVAGAVSKAKWLAVVGAVVSLAVSLLYVNAVRAVLADPLYYFDDGLMDCIGAGTWLCLVASIVGLVGAILHARRPAATGPKT